MVRGREDGGRRSKTVGESEFRCTLHEQSRIADRLRSLVQLFNHSWRSRPEARARRLRRHALKDTSTYAALQGVSVAEPAL